MALSVRSCQLEKRFFAEDSPLEQGSRLARITDF
jgi:hypothetical protein